MVIHAKVPRYCCSICSGENSEGYTAAWLHQTRKTTEKKEIIKDGLTDSNASSEINNLNQEMDLKEKLTELVDHTVENGDKSDVTDFFENSKSDQFYNDVSAGDHVHTDNIDASPGSPYQDSIHSARKLALEIVSDIVMESCCADAIECNENDTVNNMNSDGTTAEVKHLGCLSECVGDDATRNTMCTSYIKSEVIKSETELSGGEIKKENAVTKIDLEIDGNEDMQVVDPIDNGSFREKRLYENSKSDKMYVCRHCKVLFDLKGEYLQHLRDEHFRCSFLHCDKCGLKVKWRNAGEHICQMCECCNKVFYSNIALKKHKDKACKCKRCGRIFCTRVSLKSHEKTDMCKIVFPCDQCEKVFNSQTTYDRHQKKHAKYKNKAFQCELCEQGYEDYVYLKKHYLMHDGKFPCSYCKKKCYDKQHLELHQNVCSMSLKGNVNASEDTIMNEGHFGSKDEVPKSLKPCKALKTSNDIGHVENDRLIEKNIETRSLCTDDEGLDFDQPDIDEPNTDNLVLGTVDREQLNSEVSDLHDHDSVLVRKRNNASLLVISNDLFSKTLIKKEDSDIGKTVPSSCVQNGENMYSLETVKKDDKVIQNDTCYRDLDTKKGIKVRRKFDLVNSLCDYQKGSEKSSIYKDSININGKDIVNDTNRTSNSRTKPFLEETSSSEDLETDYDTDDDSSGYEECPDEEVKQMLFEMYYK